jgi:casein kinase 1
MNQKNDFFRFEGQWQLDRKISSGSFGEIFSGENLFTKERVAIKLEPIASKLGFVAKEAKLLKTLNSAPGFPKLKWFGQKSGFNVLIIDLLGPTLQDLFNALNKKLSVKSVLMIADQLLTRIQTLHSYDHLHRDIKPENLLIGRNQFANMVYVIDLGLAKKFRNSNKEHIAMSTGRGFTGNQRFCSKSAVMGIEQGRRDDLEAIGYVLIYLLKGALPWDGIKERAKSKKMKELISRKANCSIENLCEGIPKIFLEYMQYVSSLTFAAKPDYSYVKRMFREEFLANDFIYDYEFEWNSLKVFLMNTNDVSALKSKDGQNMEPELKENDANEAVDVSCKLF